MKETLVTVRRLYMNRPDRGVALSQLSRFFEDSADHCGACALACYNDDHHHEPKR